MKTKYLFPNYFKYIGFIILVPSLFLSVLYILASDSSLAKFIYDISGNSDMFAYIATMSALVLVAFSKEKHEDEYIAQIRSNSLIFAVIAQNVLVIIATCALYGLHYLDFAIYTLLTTLLIFVVKFNVALCRFRNGCKKEK